MASLADARDGKVSSFAAFTGNADPALAAFYLDSTGGDLGMAVQLYLDSGGGSGASSSSSSSSSAGGNSAGGIYNVETLASPSPFRFFKIVEADHYGQYPFIYVVISPAFCLVIDTGCGTGNLRDFLDKHVNTARRPYIVVLSHVHFDHIGGAFSFCAPPDPAGGTAMSLGDGVHAILMGNRNVKFSQNYPLTSLCHSHGTTVKPFHVSTWCEDNHRVWLGDESQGLVKGCAVDVLHTPGHSEDSVCVFVHPLNRLFVADTLYPFTAMDNSSVGASPRDFLLSLIKLKEFLCVGVPKMRAAEAVSSQVDSGGSGGGSSGGSVGSSSSSAGSSSLSSKSNTGNGRSSEHVFRLDGMMTSEALVAYFRKVATERAIVVGDDDDDGAISPAVVGTRKDFMASVRAHKGTLAPSVWSRDVAQAFKIAMNSFPLAAPLTPGSQHAGSSMAAATPGRIIDVDAASASSSSAVAAATTLHACGTLLSCGHVEANLDAYGIQNAIDLCGSIAQNALPPSKNLGDGLGEYSMGRFNMVCPLDAKWA